MGVLLLGVRRIAILPRPSAKRPVLFTVVHTYLQQSNAANVVPVSQDASRARLCRFLVSSWWSPGSVLKHSELPGLHASSIVSFTHAILPGSAKPTATGALLC